MKPTLNFILALLTLTLWNCKEPEVEISYQFQKRPDILLCDGIDPALIKEALYSFELDINKYMESRAVTNLTRIYNSTMNFAVNNELNYDEIASDHTKKIAKKLHQQTALWSQIGSQTRLNQRDAFTTCLIDNIQEDDVKTTLKALLTVGDIKQRDFINTLLPKMSRVTRNDALKLYIALDFFYSNLK